MRFQDAIACKQTERATTELCLKNKCTKINVLMRLTSVFLQKLKYAERKIAMAMKRKGNLSIILFHFGALDDQMFFQQF